MVIKFTGNTNSKEKPFNQPWENHQCDSNRAENSGPPAEFKLVEPMHFVLTPYDELRLCSVGSEYKRHKSSNIMCVLCKQKEIQAVPL